MPYNDMGTQGEEQLWMMQYQEDETDFTHADFKVHVRHPSGAVLKDIDIDSEVFSTERDKVGQGDYIEKRRV